MGGQPWLALEVTSPAYSRAAAEMNSARGSYRGQVVHEGLHRCTPGIVADLFIGWQRFLDFAHEAEALTRGEADEPPAADDEA